MTDEEIINQIAHECGWKEAFPKVGPPHPETNRGGILLPYEWVNEISHKRAMELPDYPNDLNAMHEAEKTLDSNGQICERNMFAAELRKLVHPGQYMDLHWLEWCVAHATARQRAEAFLRTIGKWVETKP